MGYAPRMPELPRMPPRTPARPPEKRKAASPRGRGFVVQTPEFDMLPDGSSRFRVPLSGTAPVDELKGPGRVAYRIKGAQVPKRNDRRPLVTSFWNTPVQEAHLENRGAHVELILTLRAPATPSSRLVPAGDGSAVLHVTFPAGSYLPGGQATPGAETASPSEAGPHDAAPSEAPTNPPDRRP
jgi:hypothetical protein